MLFHRLISVELTVFLTILSSIVFLTCPISDFVGLINLHVGLLSKLGLWSLRVMKASFCANISTRSLRLIDSAYALLLC